MGLHCGIRIKKDTYHQFRICAPESASQLGQAYFDYEERLLQSSELNKETYFTLVYRIEVKTS